MWKLWINFTNIQYMRRIKHWNIWRVGKYLISCCGSLACVEGVFDFIFMPLDIGDSAMFQKIKIFTKASKCLSYSFIKTFNNSF